MFSVDADIEVLDPMKQGPGTRTHTLSFRQGSKMEAYIVKETRQHYFVKLDDGGVAFLHKISVTLQ